MSESCITVQEIDCDNAVLVTETPTNVIDTTEPVVVLVTCEQGPAGADGADGIGTVEVASGPVSNGNTVTADQIQIAVYRSVKWFVTITDAVGLQYKAYEVMAVHNGVTANFSVYSLIGDKLSIFTDVLVVGAFLEIQLTNNSTNDVTVKIQRIATTL